MTAAPDVKVMNRTLHTKEFKFIAHGSAGVVKKLLDRGESEVTPSTIVI
jgi:hypothetical protein